MKRSNEREDMHHGSQAPLPCTGLGLDLSALVRHAGTIHLEKTEGSAAAARKDARLPIQPKAC
ncbi:hypothetical protein N1030_01860 [Desulfovibrio mangrovi]|uniref:hypothetical protein n=1 Tax=Desulfovibrio mangrovi TaxID=2976983 RepID=UPI002247B03C|nr:hypothetical protein [Desulfovibrio mangrovi]UZP67740.1 hypothetical protein N1030_01860 [Desulfovibrio mangrovi]